MVVTGMEVVSSIGIGFETFFQSATAGISGIKRIKSYDPSPYPTQMAGEIDNFSLHEMPDFDKSKRYSKVTQYALYCAHHAIQHSRLTLTELVKAGIFMGTSLGGMPELESCYQTFYTDSWKKMPSLSVLKGMPNSLANTIAIAFGLQGTNSTISNACVSSAEAIGNAYLHISEGRLPLALCGGAESLLWESVMAAWCKLRVMSTHNETPETASRPFDSTRNGMVMADGAGVLVLEDLDHAKARGATIYAEIIGYGSSCDAHHMTAPSSEGQVRAITNALDDARLSPNDVHHINAHGTGTILNDVTETATIKQVFGQHAYNIPITAQKALTGHAIGAAGALEIIATTLSLQSDTLIPTINLHTPDPDCDLDYIPNFGRKHKIDIALSNHFAFGGANAALVLRKYIA